MASSKDPVDAPKVPLDTPKGRDADIELNTLNGTPAASTSALNANPPAAGAGDTAPTDVDPLEASRALDASAPDGGLHAWLMVGCCAMLGFWFVGVTYSWGVLQTTLVERHLAPASTLAFVGSIAVSTLSFMAILNSRILTSLGARKMAIIGTIFMSFSQIFASFTTRNVGGLFVTAGVMMGLGVGFCFMVISITPAQYFTTKRGTAVGLVYAAGGLGGAVISLALEAGVRNIGLEWTFRLVGLLILVTCLPAAWYVKERTTVVRKEFVDW